MIARAARILSRQTAKAKVDCRAFSSVGFGIDTPFSKTAGGLTVTKYRIVKPYNEGTTWDDFLVTLPEKEQLASFNKEVPLFIRYLKLVTDQEGRPEDFKEFCESCKNGLQVENDVFLTVDELLAVMWKNGYTDQERNAIQFTFPSDYKFHYPELAALFKIELEDCYKFCMRTRTEKSHIGELDFEKVKRRGVLRDHWLVYAGGFYLFKNYPFFNYVFFTKFFGFSVWFYSMWVLFSRYGHRLYRQKEYMLQQKTAQEVMAGEDSIVENMKKFVDDGKCLTALKDFKGETQTTMTKYREALVAKMADETTQRAKFQLSAIERFEASASANLQETVVKTAASLFTDQFNKSPLLYDDALKHAWDSMENKASGVDPVLASFQKSLSEIASGDLMSTKGDVNGSMLERVAFAQQEKEREFRATFMVSAAEAAEVKKLGAPALSGDAVDLTKLDESSLTRLEELYKIINGKVGYAMPSEAGLQQITGDSTSKDFVDYVNHQAALAKEKLQTARLGAFVKAFA